MSEESPIPSEQSSTDQEWPGVKQSELLDESERLWHDLNVVSVSVIRHSQWLRNPNWGARFGSLSPEGVEMARESAKEWASRLPETAEVSLYESPSFVPAEQKTATGETKPITPMRASMTASLYEREVFGNMEPGKKDEFGMAQAARRTRDPRLSDFMGSKRGGDTEDFTGMRIISEVYGGVNENFWRDFYTLVGADSRVEEAIKQSGGTDYLGLAENMTEFITDSVTDLQEKSITVDRMCKEVALAVCHGETIRAFTHFLSEYLRSQGDLEAANLIHERGETEPEYTSGFDAHFDPRADKLIVIFKELGEVEVSLYDYKNYLKVLRRYKESQQS